MRDLPPECPGIRSLPHAIPCDSGTAAERRHRHHRSRPSTGCRDQQKTRRFLQREAGKCGSMGGTGFEQQPKKREKQRFRQRRYHFCYHCNSVRSGFCNRDSRRKRSGRSARPAETGRTGTSPGTCPPGRGTGSKAQMSGDRPECPQLGPLRAWPVTCLASIPGELFGNLGRTQYPRTPRNGAAAGESILPRHLAGKPGWMNRLKRTVPAAGSVTA